MPLRYKETKSQCWPGRPLMFTCSLTDFGHEAIDPYRNEAWDIIRRCPHIIFQILTKRTDRLETILPLDWGDGYENVWLGTSIGSDKSIHRMYELLSTAARTKFISFEPLHGRIESNFDLSTIMGIDWIIIGGESGNENGKYRYRPCQIDWMDELTDSFSSCGVPVFVKQMGTHLSKVLGMSDRHGSKIEEFPMSLRKREFPNSKTPTDGTK